MSLSNLISIVSENSSQIEEAIKAANKDGVPYEIQKLNMPLLAQDFPIYVNHVLIISAEEIPKIEKDSVQLIHRLTQYRICRMFLFHSEQSNAPIVKNPIDLYIQRSRSKDFSETAEQIFDFFKEADYISIRNGFFARRDDFCLRCFEFLKWFWPICYIATGIHFINVLSSQFNKSNTILESIFATPYLSELLTFFGVFFCTHALFTIIRNFLFYLFVVKKNHISLYIGIIFFLFFCWIVYCSISMTGMSNVNLLAYSGIAILIYFFYLYCRRIRSLCSSISEIQKKTTDIQERKKLTTFIGRQRFFPSAFPLFSLPTQSVFISYMHSSVWSNKISKDLKCGFKTKGFKVFIDTDKALIPPGVSWRQFLLRNLGHCSFFIAIIDTDQDETEWALTESIYAALNRKNLGYPKILVVFKNNQNLHEGSDYPYRKLYLDLLAAPSNLQRGAGFFIAENTYPSIEEVIAKLNSIKPMQLLPLKFWKIK